MRRYQTSSKKIWTYHFEDASMKLCKVCKLEKPFYEFYAQPHSKDGVGARCKECAKSAARENYRQHIDRYREYEKQRALAPHRIKARSEYAKTKRGRIAGNRAKRNFIERNPMKRAAHIAVGNAIRDGRIKRKPCEVCGSPASQAHHDDYGKPLEIRWLCVSHHVEWHEHNTPRCSSGEKAA